MKILHFSDIHCRDKNIEEIEKCLNFIVETAMSEAPDIIINAGDTFDSANIKADSLSAKLIFKIFKELADIAPVVIIIGTKSHDGQVAETLKYIKAKHFVRVATFPEQLYFAGAHDAGVLVSMCPAPTKQHFATDSDIKGADSEIAQAMSNMFLGFATEAESYKNVPHILVGHWNITGSLISDTQTLTGVDIELSKEQMELSGADIYLMGHIHFPQRIGTNIFYSGSIACLNYGELHDHGFYIYILDGKKLIEARFFHTPARKLIKLSEDLTGSQDLTDLSGIPLMEMLLAGDAPIEVKDAVVRVEFKVFQDEAAKINADEIKTSLMSSGAKEVDIRIVRIPRENIRSQKILKLTTLREKLIEMAALKNEVVPESILAKADLLESEESDKIIQEIS
jgi:exonuclease SbcD